MQVFTRTVQIKIYSWREYNNYLADCCNSTLVKPVDLEPNFKTLIRCPGCFNPISSVKFGVVHWHDILYSPSEHTPLNLTCQRKLGNLSHFKLTSTLENQSRNINQPWELLESHLRWKVLWSTVLVLHKNFSLSNVKLHKKEIKHLIVSKSSEKLNLIDFELLDFKRIQVFWSYVTILLNSKMD